MCSDSTNCAMVSNIGTSIRWPMPVRARASNPASSALAAAEPTMRSIAAIGMKRGWPVERCSSIGMPEAAWIRSS